MTGLHLRLIASSVVGLALLAFAGCDSGGGDPNAPPVPGGLAAEPGGPGPGGPGGAPSGIRKIMSKRSNGVDYLTPLIGKALEADPPDWGTIQPQAKEYARLTSTLAENDPPRGSKESWTKLATAFAGIAEALDKAAAAKDKNAALDAHAQLTESCMECHREHRRMGPGRGGAPGGPMMKGMGGRGAGGPGMKGAGGPPPDAPKDAPPPPNE
jgi:hypothetical protein